MSGLTGLLSSQTGVPQDFIDQTFEEARHFLASPLDVKMSHLQDNHYVGDAAPDGIRVNSGVATLTLDT